MQLSCFLAKYEHTPVPGHAGDLTVPGATCNDEAKWGYQAVPSYLVLFLQAFVNVRAVSKVLSWGSHVQEHVTPSLGCSVCLG